jgi:hypothetical protein
VHVALGGQVVQLVRSDGVNQAIEVAGVGQIAVVEVEAILLAGGAMAAAQVVDPRAIQARRAADDAVDRVALLQQELRKIGPILAGDAGDESRLSHRIPLAVDAWGRCAVRSGPR